MDNLRGIFLMVAAMAGFALEDMIIKLSAETVPVGQILMIIGAGGTLVFAALARRRGERLWTRALLTRPLILRNLGEVIGTMGFVSAIVLTPLSSASAILQATPLAVTLGAALFLKERVGWRRWSAIAVGFAGVLIVIRPGLEGFRFASLFAVQAVIGLALRDLSTRATPAAISSRVLSVYGFAVLVPTGAAISVFSGAPVPVDLPTGAALCAAVAVGALAYYALTAAMRVGEVGVVTPFRYSRLIFALVIGVLVFGERPDAWVLGGAAVIIGSGLYTILRERRVARPRRAAQDARGAASP